MNATNNTQTDWLTGITVVESFITTTSFRVSTGQRLATPHCTARLRAYWAQRLTLLRKIPLALQHWHVSDCSEGTVFYN
jgi:hypothetical protein